MIPPFPFHGTGAAKRQKSEPSVGLLFYHVVNMLVLQAIEIMQNEIRKSWKTQAGHKLRLNSVPPTSLSNYLLWHTGICMCVSKDACGVYMCWRIFFTMHLKANLMSVSCVKGTSFEVWNTVFPLFHLHLPASLPLVLSLSLCCTLSFCSMEVKNGVGD